MKVQYKLGLMALGLLVFTSCEKHDPIADVAQIGQRVPTCYWEVGSTACKAGGYFSFKGKYYTEDGHIPSHSEVWYNVTREDYIEASAKLGGLSYTKTLSKNEVVRANQSIVRYEHSKAIWTVSDSIIDTTATGEYGYQWMIVDSVPVSETLTPVNWAKPEKWGDTEKKNFEAYIPADFVVEFEKYVDSVIVLDAYYSNLRNVYINYEFTNKQFEDMNKKYNLQFPTDITYDSTDAQKGVTDKSTRWFDYNNPKTVGEAPVHIGYYYTTIEDSTLVYHEVGLDYVAQEGQNLQPVYESAPWVFSRYSDDAGAVINTVRPEYIPAFAELVETIPFLDWIHSSSDGYVINFSRVYMLDATYRVFDTDGNVGVAYTTYTINVN